jgi:hypothetical protein
VAGGSERHPLSKRRDNGNLIARLLALAFLAYLLYLLFRRN